MRKILLAAALSGALAATAGAAEQTGTIISVDAAAKSFVCKWQDKTWNYATTDKTTYRLKGKAAAFADIKPGTRVNVGYRTVGGGRVADWVTIEQN
jgi:hypothetical protein